MRHRSEVTVILAMAAFALAGFTALQMMGEGPLHVVDPVVIDVRPTPTVEPSPDGAQVWFQGFRMYCNPVQIDTQLRWQPAPGGAEGDMYKAACYALAGRIGQAREVIEGLAPDRRYQAAGVVFDVGHPAADAGDELAAGPLMELVVEYWPNHYMALYHAGAAAYERGERGLAEDYLKRFLREYSAQDGWRASAVSMLESIESR